MTQITVHQPLTSQLDGLVGPVEFVDESGRRIGHFLPVEVRDTDECPYSPAELDQMRREAGGRPLLEIWKSLGVS